MKILPLLLLSGALVQLPTLFAADVGKASTSVLVGQPSSPGEVSFLPPGDTDGMAWRWTDTDGRRDIGQFFTVDQPFEATTLAVKIRSGVDSPKANAPFRLIFFKDGNPHSGPGEIVAEREGILPDGKERLRNGTWLIFEFDPVPLEAGQNGFLLQFLDSDAPGQAVVLAVGKQNAAPPLKPGFYTSPSDPGSYVSGRPVAFILSSKPIVGNRSGGAHAPQVVPADPKTLVVDRRGGSPYATLATAVRGARPGDRIELAKGSGLYREILFIPQSGLPEAPIVIDGNGEVVTGFEPLNGFRKEGERWVCDLPIPFPCVLTYRGERLIQDAATGQFTRFAKLSGDRRTLELEPGIKPESWEISSRHFAVQVLNVSHHIYRNLRASGSLNDGFNLHGKGENLVFEDIEAFHNLDEGYSAHDEIQSTIEGGKFWGNDTGIGNIADSVSTIRNVECYENLGWGLWIHNAAAFIEHATIWGNGVAQLLAIEKAHLKVKDVSVAEPAWKSRPWLSYKESAKSRLSTPIVVAGGSSISGEVTVRSAALAKNSESTLPSRE